MEIRIDGTWILISKWDEENRVALGATKFVELRHHHKISTSSDRLSLGILINAAEIGCIPFNNLKHFLCCSSIFDVSC